MFRLWLSKQGDKGNNLDGIAVTQSFSVGTVQTVHVAPSTLTFSSLPAAVQARGNADGELGTVNCGTVENPVFSPS